VICILLKNEDIVKDILERELNEVRDSRTATPGQEEQTDIFLGTEKQKLTFSQLPYSIAFGSCSAKNNDIQNLKHFMNNVFT